MCNETTAALIRWIDSHNLPEPTRDNGDGTLTVACVATKDGVAFIEREKIPATRKAARDWLGY